MSQDITELLRSMYQWVKNPSRRKLLHMQQRADAADAGRMMRVHSRDGTLLTLLREMTSCRHLKSVATGQVFTVKYGHLNRQRRTWFIC